MQTNADTEEGAPATSAPGGSGERPASEEQKAPKRSRTTRTASFTPDESEYLQHIFDARVQSGITRDWNHFLRQCVDFAVNHQKGIVFAKPAIPPVPFRDAFYQSEP